MKTRKEIREVIINSLYRTYREFTTHFNGDAIRYIRRNIDRYRLAYPEAMEVGKISFLNNPDKPDTSKNRLRNTIRRVLSRRITPDLNITEKSYSAWADDISLALYGVENCIKFELLKGADVTTAYKNKIGGKSCMTGDDAYKTEAYANNPDKVKLLTAKFGGNSARALVWYTEQGEVCLDRIYKDSETLLKAMQDYAKGKSWLLRSHNNLPSGDVDFNGKTDLTVELDVGELMPYMDSFRYTDDCESHSTITLNTENGTFCFDSTGGYLPGGETCEFCGEVIEGEVYHNNYGDSYCEYCFDDNYIYCDCCEEYQDKEGAVYCNCQYYCENCAGEYLERCEECGEYVLERECTEDRHGDYYCEDCADRELAYCECCGEYHYCADIVQQVDGVVYVGECLTDNCFECEQCSDWVAIESRKEHEGNYYCEECYEEILEEELENTEVA